MTLKDWLSTHGLSMHAFAKLTGFSVVTIHNLCSGRPPVRKTVIRLVRITKGFKQPITYDMFPDVYCRASGNLLSSDEAFKSTK
jgi:transcriptional regulator with XRE-family HTH domain